MGGGGIPYNLFYNAGFPPILCMICAIAEAISNPALQRKLFPPHLTRNI